MQQLRLPLKALVFGLVLMQGSVAMASHILGGNLGYTYLGETSPGSHIYRYQVNMQFYLNCGTDSNYPTFASLLSLNGGTLPIGVYTQDPASPDADKVRYSVVNLTLADSEVITPPLPSGCSLGASLCVLKGGLTGTVDLPLNFGGYHLYFQMNSRNNTILNLNDPGATGIGFYAFIPPPLVYNSSPIWLGSSTPMLCISDTSTFINSATDPDGDQLIFSFKRPYGSVSSGGGIIQPPATLPNNIPLVDYAPGYNVTQPLGNGGYAYINGATGLTRYLPPNQGNYVVAVEVREFRNGNLIGITRRDLQLQATVCPPNATPVAVAPQPETYTVQAGDNLCFDLGFQDPEGDSLHLSASGTIFNGTLYDPPATITAPASGNGTVSSTFCWDTQCDQGQAQPYLFSVSVNDAGCPPRTLDVVYQVFVAGIAAPSPITGPEQVCPGQTATYSSTAAAGNTVTWTVSGGSISSGQGTSTITVDWGAAGAGSVSVSANNAQGCTSTAQSLPVAIVPAPDADAGPDATICAGSTVVLGGAPSGPAGSGFLWNPAQELSDQSVANPIATPSSSTAFVLQVTRNGCTNSDTVIVTVSQPSVDAGADAAFCAGGQTQLNATGIGSVAWSPNNGLDDASLHDPIASPASTTTYIATLTDSIGCTAADSVTVTVNSLPTADAGPDLTPCPNTTVNLGGAPTGTPGSTFIWIPGTGLNDDAAANPELSVTGSVQFTVTVTDANTCSASDQVTVTVLPLPLVNAGPDRSVCAGDSIVLQGAGAGDLLWTPGSGLNDPTLPNPVCTPEASIIYTLTVTGSNNCTNSDQATVTVNVLPNANAGPDHTICAGDSIQLGTSGPGIFTWGPATGLSETDVATPMASPSATTTYFVQLSDSLTCAAMDSVTVNVLPQPNAGMDGSLSICGSGQPTALLAQLGGSPDAGGSWSGTDMMPHAPDLDPASDPSGAYTYIIGAGSQCVDSAVVLVEVMNPTIAFSGDSSLCVGGSTQISASGGVLFAWSPTSGVSDPITSSPVISPDSTTAYNVQVTDTAGCSATAQLTVTVHPLPLVDAGNDTTICAGTEAMLGGIPTSPTGTGYQWMPAAGLNDGAVANPVATAMGTTMYTVAVSDAEGCTNADSMLLTVQQPPALDAGPDTSFCNGGSVQLNATGTGSFLWSPTTDLSDPETNDPLASPANTIAYVVTLTDGIGCSSEDSLTVTVHTLPTVSTGPDPWLCLGSSVVLSSTGSSGTYAWAPSGSLNDPASTAPNATPSSTTTFTVTVTDINNCVGSDVVTVTVGTDPPIDVGQDQNTCAGIPVELGGSPTSVTGSSFLWAPSSGLSDPTAANPTASPTNSTEYMLTVTNDTCTSTASVLVNIGTQGQAGFTARLEPGCDALRAFLLDTSTEAATWHWTLGNGATSEAQNPQTTLPYGANTLITLVITDGSGCTDTISQLFAPGSYNELVQVELPNVFTPNRDGENDFFTLGTSAFLGPCASMEIMNRWGQTVYLSQGNDISWDGRTNAGIPAIPGTYYYVVRVKDIRFTGSLTLLR